MAAPKRIRGGRLNIWGCGEKHFAALVPGMVKKWRVLLVKKWRVLPPSKVWGKPWQRRQKQFVLSQLVLTPITPGGLGIPF